MTTFNVKNNDHIVFLIFLHFILSIYLRDCTDLVWGHPKSHFIMDSAIWPLTSDTPSPLLLADIQNIEYFVFFNFTNCFIEIDVNFNCEQGELHFRKMLNVFEIIQSESKADQHIISYSPNFNFISLLIKCLFHMNTTEYEY